MFDPKDGWIFNKNGETIKYDKRMAELISYINSLEKENTYLKKEIEKYYKNNATETISEKLNWNEIR